MNTGDGIRKFANDSAELIMWIGHRKETLYSGQLALSTQLIIPNYFVIPLPPRRSTKVSLGTYHLYSYVNDSISFARYFNCHFQQWASDLIWLVMFDYSFISGSDCSSSSSSNEIFWLPKQNMEILTIYSTVNPGDSLLCCRLCWLQLVRCRTSPGWWLFLVSLWHRE